MIFFKYPKYSKSNGNNDKYDIQPEIKFGKVNDLNEINLKSLLSYIEKDDYSEEIKEDETNGNQKDKKIKKEGNMKGLPDTLYKLISQLFNN